MDWQIGRVGKAVIILIQDVGVVTSILNGATLFLLVLKPMDVNFIQTKLPEMSDLCYLGKTRLNYLL